MEAEFFGARSDVAISVEVGFHDAVVASYEGKASDIKFTTLI